MRRWGGVALLAVSIAAPVASRPYDRADWPHWTTSDGCQDTRTKVLARDATRSNALVWELEKCQITAGEWLDPYAADGRGLLTTDPGQLHVDHTIALKWASDHGGAHWSRERKEAFANYLGFRYALRVLQRGPNLAKGARGPAEWVPPNMGAWCEYGLSWSALLVVWDLRPGEADREAIRRLVETC